MSAGTEATAEAERIGWVDAYVRSLKPYVHVREADSVLIKVPNEAYKLDAQGLKLMKFLLAGGTTGAVLARYTDRDAVARDIHEFFTGLRSLLKGCWRETDRRPAIRLVPFELPYNLLPVLSEAALGYGCNLSCRFCYAGCGVENGRGGGGLSTQEWKKVLDVIRLDAEVPSVSFTGGEPCARPDLPALVRHAKGLGMWTNLITNGTLVTRELAAELKSAGLDSAQVSIEAGEAALHDRITGLPGAFTAALGGIRALREAGVRLHTNTTISAMNKDRLEGVVRLAAGLGLERLSMNMLMPAGSAEANMAELFISYSEIGPVVLGAREAAAGLGLEFMWYSPTPMCVFNPVAHGLGNKGCAACDGLLSVAPDGGVLPCSSWPSAVGNILERPFRELWAGPEARFFQEKRFAHARCRECVHLAVCNGGCPLYWKARGYGELGGD